jgi:hypothetical protein
MITEASHGDGDFNLDIMAAMDIEFSFFDPLSISTLAA